MARGWLRITSGDEVVSVADQEYAQAQFNLGSMYYHGKGLAQDYSAAKWYRMAADQGDAKAQYGLGSMYYHGKGGLRIIQRR